MAQLPPGFPGIPPPPPPPSWFFPPYLRLPPPPPLPKPSTSQGRIAVAIIIAFVTSLLVFTAVWALCWEYHRRARAAAAVADRPSPEHGSGHVEERPLRQACAASRTAGLPAFTYTQSVKHNVTDDGEEAATCSVCLGEFQLGETVRLLPVCLHLYHSECIDPWLDSHSTCPLCRSDIDPNKGVGLLPHV